MNVAVVVIFVVVFSDVLTERRLDNDLPREKMWTKLPALRSTERPTIKENMSGFMETFRPKSIKNLDNKKSKENVGGDFRTTPKSVSSIEKTQPVRKKYENLDSGSTEKRSNSAERQTTVISVDSTIVSSTEFPSTQDFGTASESVTSERMLTREISSSTELPSTQDFGVVSSSEITATQDFVTSTEFPSTQDFGTASESVSSERMLTREISSSTEFQSTFEEPTSPSTEETSEQTSFFPFAEEEPTTTETPCPETPPEIDFYITSTNDFNVSLQWDPLENNTCVENYTIYLDGDVKAQTSETTYTITELNACTQYSVGVGVNFGTVNGPFNPVHFTTEQPQNFNYSVQNLEITEDADGYLNVTWQGPPDEVIQCITNYSVVWWLEDNKSEDRIIEAPQTSTTVNSTPCSNITVQVTPLMGPSQGVLQITDYAMAPRVQNRPDLVSSQYGSRYINVTWKTDTNNNCALEKIFLSCNAFELPNVNYSWIVWEKSVIEDIIIQNPNKRYPMTINELSPFTNYTCYARIQNEAGNSTDHKITSITTDQEVPQSPQPVTITDVNVTEFTINWTEPKEVPGVLIEYRLIIYNNGPLHSPSTECSGNWTTFNSSIRPDQTSFHFDSASPYHNFTISVVAVDGAGDSEPGVAGVVTLSKKPDPIVNLQKQDLIYSTNDIYNTTVKISYEPPCNINGAFKTYEISYNGIRQNFPDDHKTISTDQTSIEIINLQPERSYTFAIVVVTETFISNSSTLELTTKAGVPLLNKNNTPPEVNNTGKALFTLSKSSFDNVNGEIVAWALILATSHITGESFGFREVDEWPEVPHGTVQLTENGWNPFTDEISEIIFVIGNDESCQNTTHVCNKRLREGTKYWLLVRAFTEAAYKDSALLYFQTNMPGDDYKTGLILGLTFGLLALIALIILLVFLWRRRRKSYVEEVEKRPSTATTAAIPVQKFATYYASIKENYNIIKEQYTDLGTQSKEVAGPITFATLVENRRKNRYTNILPFDETRVKLKIDEDDEISSDYINASYIRGYSGKIEYIATQGPLESTTRDFWKMVLQENVSIIVMVSQFVEQSKEKCYQYFPNNHESVTFGESLEVKCSTELHFGTYCMRTLQLRKGTEQRHVIHMQFLEWPDFGVPQGTDNMLQFCTQLREKATSEGGVIVVHCSAGVGRTGTLIALDILLQTIDHHRDINIYRTVFDLRKQRINMVQTEKQYMFIHTCVKEYIEAPPILSNETSGERIYENMDVLRSSLKKNLIETELESAL